MNTEPATVHTEQQGISPSETADWVTNDVQTSQKCSETEPTSGKESKGNTSMIKTCRNQAIYSALKGHFQKGRTCITVLLKKDFI